MTVEAARDLHKDQRGAIMLLGLCMACFLIGGLWFLIGIGDTIVFRDQMQEATDHAAFTSAVLHAKGMNFISACNLVLLALIAIHILMGIIHDILLAICIAASLFSLGTSCVPWANFRPLYTNYFRIMTPVANGIHYAENVAQIGYPFLAVAKAYTLGHDYGEFGPKKRRVNILALSTSLVPGGAMSSAVNGVFGQHGANNVPEGAAGPERPASGGHSKSEKGFLPVEPKHFDSVCQRIAGQGLEFLVGLTGQHLPSSVQGVFTSIVGKVLKLRYCNDLGEGAMDSITGGFGNKMAKGNARIGEDNKIIDRRNARRPNGAAPEANINPVKDTGGDSYVLDPGFSKFWGKDGPYVPWVGTSNGSAWQQIWAINIMPSFEDERQAKVHIGANNKAVQQNAKAWAYLAEAEFFYDCTDEWDTHACNFEDGAGYGIKWRARLRRLQLPQVGSLLSGYAREFMANFAAYKRFKEQFGTGEGGALGGLADKFGQTMGGAAGVGAINGAIDGIFEQIERQIGLQVIFPAGGAIDRLQNGLTGNFGVYH